MAKALAELHATNRPPAIEAATAPNKNGQHQPPESVDTSKGRLLVQRSIRGYNRASQGGGARAVRSPSRLKQGKSRECFTSCRSRIATCPKTQAPRCSACAATTACAPFLKPPAPNARRMPCWRPATSPKPRFPPRTASFSRRCAASSTGRCSACRAITTSAPHSPPNCPRPTSNSAPGGCSAWIRTKTTGWAARSPSGSSSACGIHSTMGRRSWPATTPR